MFENGKFTEIKPPTPKKYFFFENIERPKEKKYRNVNNKEKFTEDEKRFFREFKNKPFMVSDMVKTINKTFSTAYRTIIMLRSLGLVEEVSNGAHPKMFKLSNKLYEIID